MSLAPENDTVVRRTRRLPTRGRGHGEKPTGSSGPECAASAQYASKALWTGLAAPSTGWLTVRPSTTGPPAERSDNRWYVTPSFSWTVDHR